MTPLRRKLLDDLQLRNYAPGTQEAYVRAIAQFARHYGRSPDQLGAVEVRRYLLYLIQDRGTSWSVYNVVLCALRFFYHVTLDRKGLLSDLPAPRWQKRLPTVLSPTEIHRLFQIIPNLKHRAVLMTIYATGLRVSEAATLRPDDIHSRRMLVRVRHGTGRKERYVPLSPRLLEALRHY